MSASRITGPRSTVEHLGVWAPDRISDPQFSWRTGRMIPLCGQIVGDARWTQVESTSWRENRQVKPLCSRCAAAVADFSALLDVSS